MTDVLARILDTSDEIVALRHRIHAHPELSLEEHETSNLVAERLHAWGYEVHRGLAKTGVVGTLKVGGPAPVASACVQTWTRCRSRSRQACPMPASARA